MPTPSLPWTARRTQFHTSLLTCCVPKVWTVHCQVDAVSWYGTTSPACDICTSRQPCYGGLGAWTSVSSISQPPWSLTVGHHLKVWHTPGMHGAAARHRAPTSTLPSQSAESPKYNVLSCVCRMQLHLPKCMGCTPLSRYVHRLVSCTTPHPNAVFHAHSLHGSLYVANHHLPGRRAPY